MKRLPYPIRILHVIVIGATIVFCATVTSIARSKRPEKLPDVLEQSIRNHFPDAQIQDFEHHRRIIHFIEITIVDHHQEYELTLSPDGSVMFIKHEMDSNQLPSVVLEAIQQAMGPVSIEEAEQMDIHAELKPVPLNEPRIQYEVEFRSKGRKQEIVVFEDGTLVTATKRLKWEDND